MRTTDRIHNLEYLKKRRQKLRALPTEAESELWKHISNRQLEGRKFRQQHSIGNYIVDFYCPSEQLIIELDGGYHLKPKVKKADEIRDNILKEMGFKILRFVNDQVFDDLENVLEQIKKNL